VDVLEYYIKSVRDKIDAIEEEITKMRVSVGGSDRKAAPLGKCDFISDFNGVKSSAYKRTWSGYGEASPREQVTNATKHLNALWQKSQDAHEANKPIIESNTAIRAALEAFMLTIGIDKEFHSYEYKTARSRNRETITKTAGWVLDMHRALPVDDGFRLVEQRFKDYEARIQQWEREVVAEERRIAEASRLAERLAKQEQMRAVLAVKYEMAFTSTLENIWAFLITQDGEAAQKDLAELSTIWEAPYSEDDD
jgi:hypothetical protein